MKRYAALVYGGGAYAVFLGVFLYAVGFIGNFLVPTTLDGEPGTPLWQALVVDLAVLTLFALQHSVMARPAFKRWWTRMIAPAIERSTYVLFTCIALILMFWLWQPIGGVVWHVTDPVGKALLYGLFGFGWLLVLIATFLINHFDLFGLRQVWLYFRGKPYTALRFVTPGPYRVVRHPLYVGWLFVFWATPSMTAAHLLFACATTAYILLAIQLEERDLLKAHGEDYAAYRARVPMILPRLLRRSADKQPGGRLSASSPGR